MNWEPISAISEIVSAIAVLVTLVFLARQIAMSKLFSGGLQADLGKDQQALVNSWAISAFQIYEQLFREVHSGILDPIALDEFAAHSAFRLAFIKEQWPFYRMILSPPVVEYLEGKYDLS